MDSRITPFQFPSIGTAAPLAPGGRAAAGAAQAQSATSFSAALDSALASVSRAQDGAAELQRQYQMGVPGVGLEQTMVAMQKAQLGFQAALAVRNRLVSAYTDIMNMQV